MEISIKMIMNMVQTQNCKIWLHFQLVSRIYYFLAKKNFSSVSARKLKCSSSARLGSELSQLRLARAGKFQLKLISRRFQFEFFKRCFLISFLTRFFFFFTFEWEKGVLISCVLIQNKPNVVITFFYRKFHFLVSFTQMQSEPRVFLHTIICSEFNAKNLQ